MSYLRAIAFWSFAWTYTMLIFIVLGIAVFFLRIFDRRRIARVAHFHAGLWARGYFNVIPGWSIEVTGLDQLPQHGSPVVYVSNHQSMADIWAMYCIGRDFCWLSKDSVFRLPMLGMAMHWAEYIPIVRNSRDSALQAMEASKQMLLHGRSMFFFPEGTRSLDDNLLPFKLGAFRLAEELNLPIVPITIDGAGRLMRKGSLIPNRSRVKLHIDRPTRMQAHESLEQYAARVRELIATNLGRIRK